MVVGIAALAALTFIGAGAALATSDGVYSQERQGCHDQTLDNQNEDNEPEGVNGEKCHNATARLDDGSGHTYARGGTLATKEGEFVHEHDATINDTEGADPASGLHLYFGADDNLNGGEHDGSDLVGPSPSDGGGVALDLTPDNVAVWMAALMTGDASYLLAHPAPFATFGTGACADGVCFGAATDEHTAYQGGDTTKKRNVADYDGKEWDPDSCSGEDDGPESCDDPNVAGDQDITYWRDKEGNVVMQPGVAVYEDPDPQGSPLEITGYPTVGIYAGTCGVIAGGGGATPQAPASPVTNSAGQVEVGTGCG